MSLIPGESLRSLKHEYSLIRLLYHRNKNQHRASVWWRHFNGLKRVLTKLIPLLEASLTSKKFQRGAQTLEIARYVKFILVKKCYRAFNGIIALGQFITFGMTLVGILSRVDLDLGKIEGINDRIKVGNQSKVSKVSNEDFMNVDGDLGEEVGEEVSKEIMKNVEGEEKIEKKPLQPNKSSMDEIFSSSKIKKKKKSDQKRSIDDIFREKKVKKAHEMAENVSSHRTKEKKNKKKKSAIDDIFGGF